MREVPDTHTYHRYDKGGRFCFMIEDYYEDQDRREKVLTNIAIVESAVS